MGADHQVLLYFGNESLNKRTKKVASPQGLAQVYPLLWAELKQFSFQQIREHAQIDENHVLQEDILFSSPSGAAVFVIGQSANGWDA